MAVKPLFNASNVKCEKHSAILLEPGEKECILCEVANKNLQLIPPFKALCKFSTAGIVKDKYYEVLFVVRDGAAQGHGKDSGFVIREIEGKNKTGGIYLNIFNADRFVCEQYMNKEELETMEKKIG